MTELIRAVVYHAPGDVRMERVPRPSCEAGGLLVRVEACAVCGSDLKAFRSGNPRLRPPVAMGHEFTGLVEEVGAGAEGFAPGDRVVMATSVSCGTCACCRRGWPNLCMDLAPMGFAYPGGMAEAVAIPARAVRNGHVVKVPPGLPAAHAALAEPISCAVNAGERCEVRSGDVVVVVGAGPMGLINACVARALGARAVVVAEVNAARIRQAAGFGLDRLVDPAAEDLAAVVRELTDGAGADVAIVTAPAAKPQEDALALVRKRGTVCLFASLPEGGAAITLDSRRIHYGELRVVGSSDSTAAHVRRALGLMREGSLPLDRLVTHRLGLEAFRQAFDVMASGEALRVVLVP